MKRVAALATRGIFLTMLGLSAACATETTDEDALEVAAPRDATGGLRVVEERRIPGASGIAARTIFEDPGVLREVLNAGWSEGQQPLCARLRAELSKRDAVASGVRLYGIRCKGPRTGALHVEEDGHGVLLTYRVADDTLEVTSTQPTPFGSWADPHFAIRYDLVLYATFAPSSDGSVGISAAGARVENVRVEPVGPVASLTLAVYDVIRGFFGAPRFGDLVTREANDALVGRLGEQIEHGLASVNETLKRAVGAAHDRVRLNVDPSGLLVVTVFQGT
jgi:hypothetical protein